MAEYKDITKLKKEISDVKQELWESSCQNRSYITGYVSALSYVEGMIASLPAADVEPVKRGYIVIKPRVIGGFVNHKCPNPQCKHKWQTDERVKISEMLCSECGKVLAHNYQNYCPYCGAKMDEKEVQE